VSSLKNEIIANLSQGAKTIEQLTRLSKLTRHEHRVGLAIRELVDSGVVQEPSWEPHAPRNLIHKYFLSPEIKNPQTVSNPGARSNTTRSHESIAKTETNSKIINHTQPGV